MFKATGTASAQQTCGVLVFWFDFLCACVVFLVVVVLCWFWVVVVVLGGCLFFSIKGRSKMVTS